MPTNCGWISPQRLSDDPKLVLFSDQNSWNLEWVTVPHGPGGQVKKGGTYKGTGITPSGGKNPKQMGALGGNSATLDGAVAWRNAKQRPTNYLIYSGGIHWAFW